MKEAKDSNHEAGRRFARTPGSAWVSTETKPPTGRKVLVCGHYANGNRWRTMARWYPAGTLDATMWDDPPEEWWDGSGNVARCPHDAWWEESIEVEAMAELENVTHWMPLPELPNGQGEAQRPDGDASNANKNL